MASNTLSLQEWFCISSACRMIGTRTTSRRKRPDNATRCWRSFVRDAARRGGPAMTLKVLSYNIREGGDVRLQGIAAIIRQQQPDALALLEATSRANALTLARDLEMQLVFGEANNGIHVAWLSCLPIQGERNHRLTVLAKTLLEIEVAWEGAPLRLFATHLASRWGDHSPCYSRELLRLRTPQRATLAPEGSIQARFAVQASQGPAP